MKTKLFLTFMLIIIIISCSYLVNYKLYGLFFVDVLVLLFLVKHLSKPIMQLYTEKRSNINEIKIISGNKEICFNYLKEHNGFLITLDTNTKDKVAYYDEVKEINEQTNAVTWITKEVGKISTDKITRHSQTISSYYFNNIQVAIITQLVLHNKNKISFFDVKNLIELANIVQNAKTNNKLIAIYLNFKYSNKINKLQNFAPLPYPTQEA